MARNSAVSQFPDGFIEQQNSRRSCITNRTVKSIALAVPLAVAVGAADEGVV
jgi:hypothetical protein